jgi:hypothetical protein
MSQDLLGLLTDVLDIRDVFPRVSEIVAAALPHDRMVLWLPQDRVTHVASNDDAADQPRKRRRCRGGDCCWIQADWRSGTRATRGRDRASRSSRTAARGRLPVVPDREYLDTLSTAAPHILVETTECVQPAGCDRRPAHCRLRGADDRPFVVPSRCPFSIPFHGGFSSACKSTRMLAYWESPVIVISLQPPHLQGDPQAKVAAMFSSAASLERAASKLLPFQQTQPVCLMGIAYGIVETG